MRARGGRGGRPASAHGSRTQTQMGGALVVNIIGMECSLRRRGHEFAIAHTYADTTMSHALHLFIAISGGVQQCNVTGCTANAELRRNTIVTITCRPTNTSLRCLCTSETTEKTCIGRLQLNTYPALRVPWSTASPRIIHPAYTARDCRRLRVRGLTKYNIYRPNSQQNRSNRRIRFRWN